MLPWDQSWEQLYKLLGASEVIHFISSANIQRSLLPIKVVFIFFGFFFLGAVIYFYIRSSYMKYQFLQDTVEFLSWQPYGLRQINKQWRKIMQIIGAGSEKEYKLAVVQADDLLYKTLEERGYEGESFEQLLKNAREKIIPIFSNILSAHSVRNSIIYEPDYKLDIETAKKIMDLYEKAIKNI